MVKYADAALDRTFSALADPTRRALLAQLSLKETVSVSELARPFAVSLPAIMKHLDVLSEAGLIARSKTGRVVACRLTAGPMEEAVTGPTPYKNFGRKGPDRRPRFVEEKSCRSPAPASPPSQASPSAAGS